MRTHNPPPHLATTVSLRVGGSPALFLSSCPGMVPSVASGSFPPLLLVSRLRCRQTTDFLSQEKLNIVLTSDLSRIRTLAAYFESVIAKVERPWGSVCPGPSLLRKRGLWGPPGTVVLRAGVGQGCHQVSVDHQGCRPRTST